MKPPPLIVHVIHRLAIGGLENGLVNLINNMPVEKYRHAIVCLDDFTDFRTRIIRDDVDCYALHKKPGQDFGLYVRLWRLLRKLKPKIIHTRNIGTLECVIPAMLARVPVRIHGEHGRDMVDIDGTNSRYILLRRVLKRFVHYFVALSQDLEMWLKKSVYLNNDSVIQIYNGVDMLRFKPGQTSKEQYPTDWYPHNNPVVIGTIGRLKGEKNQELLVDAFTLLISKNPSLRLTTRLVLIGDGPLFSKIERKVRDSNIADLVWMAGARNDMPEMFNGMDIFVLPSLGEGISNTILEAMSSGLPVIATNVGGNPELVKDSETGMIVESGNIEEMAICLQTYIENPERITAHGQAGRRRIEEKFSLNKMVDNYLSIYDMALRKYSRDKNL